MKKTKGKLGVKLMFMTTMPILVMSLVIIVFTYLSFNKALQKEIRHELKSMADTVLNAYDMMYEGDYTAYADGEEIIYKKGDFVISDDHSFLDRIKWETDIDITFFYYDIRVLTTLKDAEKNRYIGTTCNTMVVNDVLKNGDPTFYESVKVGTVDYFAYYAPVYNPNGSCVGMIFAGKPTQVVKGEMNEVIVPIIIIGLLAILISGLMCHSFSKEMVIIIKRMRHFLRDISQGNLKTELDKRIVQRNDELGEMGRFMSKVQLSLRDMIEKDALTKLYCRRFGDKKLNQMQKAAIEYGTVYSLVLADIDFFKRFNDSYGHDCGDLVLIEIAKIFSEEMLGKGVAVRWGGEEFLLLYDDLGMEQALKHLKKIREKVLALEIPYNDEVLKVTMTFGVTQGSSKKEIKDIIKKADELLYEGKLNGRNQIVADELYLDI